MYALWTPKEEGRTQPGFCVRDLWLTASVELNWVCIFDWPEQITIVKILESWEKKFEFHVIFATFHGTNTLSSLSVTRHSSFLEELFPDYFFYRGSFDDVEISPSGIKVILAGGIQMCKLATYLAIETWSAPRDKCRFLTYDFGYRKRLFINVGILFKKGIGGP